jgi:hypothetical protein
MVMTQRGGTTIKQSAVSGVISRLSELPDRGKDPSTAISLGKVFRTKEYLAEIKGALKKGYTFDDLAAIFSERCGVNISARQIKYHFTHAKNAKKRSAKGKPGKKPGDNGGSGNHADSQSADSQRKTAEEDVKETLGASDSMTKESLNFSGFASKNRAAARAEVDADFDTFQPGNEPKGSRKLL